MLTIVCMIRACRNTESRVILLYHAVVSSVRIVINIWPNVSTDMDIGSFIASLVNGTIGHALTQCNNAMTMRVMMYP